MYSLCFRSGNASHSREDLEAKRQASGDILVDPDHQFGIDIPGVEPQDLLIVTPGLQSDMEGGNKTALYQADVDRAQAARPASRIERVDVLRVLAQLLLRKVYCLCIQRVNSFRHGRIGGYSVLAAEKPVVGIESGVEQIETIKLAEKDRVEHIIHSERIAGIFAA